MVPLLNDPKKTLEKSGIQSVPEWINRITKEVKERELYDLKNDPLCKESIVFRPENKECVEKLHVQMAAGWQNAKP